MRIPHWIWGEEKGLEEDKEVKQGSTENKREIRQEKKRINKEEI